MEHKKERDLLNVDLLHGSIGKSILLFAFPVMLSYLFQQLYNAVDTMIVGNCLGDLSLAAMGASASIFELMVGFGQGIANGFGIVVARAYGSGNEKKLREAIATALWLGILFVIIMVVAFREGVYPLLRVLGTPQSIIEQSYSYIGLIADFVFVLFFYNLFASILRAIGNSVMPVVFLILSTVINIILDIVFMTQLHMGVRGAAVATVIAQGISVILCMVYIWKCCKKIIPKKEDFVIVPRMVWDMLGQGVSMGLMFGLVSSGTVILQSAINSFGETIIAGHIAARKLYVFIAIPIFSLSLSMSTVVSQNRGAGNKERIRKSVRFAGLFLSGWSIFCVILMAVGVEPCLKLLTGSSNLELLSYGRLYMLIFAPFFLVLSWLAVLRNALQGLGYKVLPIVSSVIELVGKILFTWIIIPRMGLLGIILCEPLIWVAMTAQLVWAYKCNPYMSG